VAQPRRNDQSANSQLPLPWQWRELARLFIAEFVISFDELSHSMLTDRLLLAIIRLSKRGLGQKPWKPRSGETKAVTLVFQHRESGAAGKHTTGKT
jgi:hypothetical protein